MEHLYATEIELLTTPAPVQWSPSKGWEAVFITLHAVILLASLLGNSNDL